MTWRRTALYLAIWAMLSAYYVLFERAAPPLATSVQPSTLGLRAADVSALEIAVADRRLRCVRDAAGWSVIEPPGTRVPADLVHTLIATVTEAPLQEVAGATEGRAADFGLDRPRVRVQLESPAAVVRVALGARNPPQTAVYAQVQDNPQVVLIGLNVEYYVDLLLANVAPPAA